MKKTITDPKAKNVQTSRLAPFAIQRGANTKAKKPRIFPKKLKKVINSSRCGETARRVLALCN
jgi:hypothetical protein